MKLSERSINRRLENIRRFLEATAPVDVPLCTITQKEAPYHVVRRLEGLDGLHVFPDGNIRLYLEDERQDGETVVRLISLDDVAVNRGALGYGEQKEAERAKRNELIKKILEVFHKIDRGVISEEADARKELSRIIQKWLWKPGQETDAKKCS